MSRPRLVLALLLTTTAGWCAERPGTPAPPGIVPPNAPKSSFVDEPGVGRDPFFPNSRRRAGQPAPETGPVRPDIPEFISLKGISLIQGKKLALINNYTVAEGEEFPLKFRGQPIKVKCIEIKERVVVIEVNGVAKELSLRPGL